MILEDSQHWYADDGGLSKTFCEQTEKDVKYDEEDCCACEEAKYSVSLFCVVLIYRFRGCVVNI